MWLICRFVKSKCNRAIAVTNASFHANHCVFLGDPLNIVENHLVVFASSNTAITIENNIFLGGNARRVFRGAGCGCEGVRDHGAA